MKQATVEVETDLFLLNGTHPRKVEVRDTTPPENKTRLYSVVADYGWAETILCSECYLRDANGIAMCISARLDIPALLAKRR